MCQSARDLAQISDIQVQLEEAMKEKQEIQDKVHITTQTSMAARQGNPDPTESPPPPIPVTPFYKSNIVCHVRNSQQV